MCVLVRTVIAYDILTLAAVGVCVFFCLRRLASLLLFCGVSAENRVHVVLADKVQNGAEVQRRVVQVELVVYFFEVIWREADGLGYGGLPSPGLGS